ncbi:MAG: TetR family transcriptional regulator [Solirubrobacterales bacterium]|nr:TetR family transcriptional regulator [Solirubrobacterales bacterium]
MAAESNIARRRAAARIDPRASYVERRREIVCAAATVFKERGFRGTTLAHIADAMGADRASLYYYVASKQELFREIVSDAVRVNLATATAIRDGGGDDADKLRRLMESLMRSYAEFYPVLYVLIQENFSHVDPERGEWAREMRELNLEYETVLTDVIASGQAAGILRDRAPAWLIAHGVMGMFGWTNRWFNPNRSPLTADEVGRAFADLLLDGVRA